MTNTEKIMAANDEIKRQAQTEIIKLDMLVATLRSKNSLVMNALQRIKELTRRNGWNDQDDIHGQVFRIASVADSLVENL